MKHSILNDMAGLLAGLLGLVAVGNVDFAVAASLYRLPAAIVLFMLAGALLRAKPVRAARRRQTGQTVAARPTAPRRAA